MTSIASFISRLRQSQLFNDSFWALLGSALGKGLSLLAGIAIAKFLGSELYGEYGTIKNTLLMIAIFSSMGLGYSATKFIAESRSRGENSRIICTHRIASTITFIVSSIIAILVFIFAEQISLWLEASQLVTALRISSIAIIFNAINTTQAGELAGFGAYRRLAINNAYSGIFTFILSVALAYFYGFYGAITALTISLIFNALLNYISIRKCLSDYDTKAIIEHSYTKEIILFSLPIALQEGLYSITNWLGIFILIKLSGYVELGLYSAAMQWMSVILFIPGALRNVALSHLSATTNDNKRNHSILVRLMLINLASTLIPFFIIYLLSGFIENFYGDSFIGLQPVLNICVFTAVINSLTNVLTQEFMAQNRNWFLFISRLLRDTGSLIVAYIAIIHEGHGAKIMSLAFLCCQIIYLIILFLVYYKLHVSTNYKSTI